MERLLSHAALAISLSPFPFASASELAVQNLHRHKISTSAERTRSRASTSKASDRGTTQEHTQNQKKLFLNEVAKEQTSTATEYHQPAWAPGEQEGSSLECIKYPKVMFAMGCFWCAEEALRELLTPKDPCVNKTILSGLVGPFAGATTRGQLQAGRSQYGGGPTAGPERYVHYHIHDPELYTEAVQFRTSLPFTPDILHAFWTNVDPLDGGGQFDVRGDKVRSGIYAQTPEQFAAAKSSIAEVAQVLGKDVADIKTFVQGFSENPWLQTNVFYPSEEKQQNYFNKVGHTVAKDQRPRTIRLKELWDTGNAGTALQTALSSVVFAEKRRESEKAVALLSLDVVKDAGAEDVKLKIPEHENQQIGAASDEAGERTASVVAATGGGANKNHNPQTEKPENTIQSTADEPFLVAEEKKQSNEKVT
ncbi:unnamed protein product [Amoebophrya sp. A120]|nr:unnamed protein product [Amoebophrya sp. A120]|eukprot:GSA120T00018731001.1